jgi:dienelactone hydrolase
MRRLTATILLLGALLGSAAARGDDETVARTWREAQIYVRYETEELTYGVIGGPMTAAYIAKHLKRYAETEPQPVIIHLHGCGRSDGLSDIQSEARAMAELGFIVVAPDSFARPGRPESCDPRKAERFPDAPHALINRYRQEELRYALAQVLAAPWADPNRIFVSGFDEGADAVLGFRDPAVLGRIAIGAPCRFDPVLDPNLPTLIIIARDDLWFSEMHEPALAGQCRRKLGGQPNVSILEPEGVLHDALIYNESKIALWNFLVRASFL